ncbi:titin homolog [Sitodiplosis mosellana]|uniref:titin homolog n=1 Tax=Sitodiplosis mosellana TaxID=263140 RepID=UPI0024441121|nr:titin homolog [Sitodiplosis mosellana]
MKNSQRITPKIPDGMVELMKNLAKSVLKEQPDNIYLFAAEYFENLVRERDGSLDKGYSTFRKYDDVIAKRRGGDVCPRCNCTLHPERKEDDEPAEGEGNSSPRNDDDEKALDMSVNGVAIKAMPRDGKSSKGQKSRQRLETIRSVSMDSAIEDDSKSQLTSPKSNSQDKPIDPQLNLHSLSALSAINPNILDNTNEHKAHESTENRENESNENVDEGNAVVESPKNEEIVEPLSNNKLPTDDDVPDTPTNDTSLSETITDRTVIEVAPLNSESKNDELNTSESTQADDLDVKPNTADTIPTIVTESIEEQNPIDDGDVVKTTEPADLQLEQVKQMDRLRTPESDSGLSEKSFNLNIQENEESVTNEVNEAKDEPDKLLSVNEKEFDATSKDDSGIVDVGENLITSQMSTQNELAKVAENEKENEESKPTNLSAGDDENVENIVATEEQPTIDNVNATENVSENRSQEMNENVPKEKEKLPKTTESNVLKEKNEAMPLSATASQIVRNDPVINVENQCNELSSEEKMVPDSTEPDSKSNLVETTDNNREKIGTEADATAMTPEQESEKSAEPTNGEPKTAQSLENVAQTQENKEQSEEKPQSPDKTVINTKDEPDSNQTEGSQKILSNENDPNTSESTKLEEIKEQPSDETKLSDESEKTGIESNTQVNEATNDDNKSVKHAANEEPKEINEQVNKTDEKESDVKTTPADIEKENINAEIAEQRQATADSSKQPEEIEEKSSDTSNEENTVDETNSDQKQTETIISLVEHDAPKSADQTDKIDNNLNETSNDVTSAQGKNHSTNKDELNSDENTPEMKSEIETESSTEKQLEEEKNKRNKREIGSIDEGSTKPEMADEQPNNAMSTDKLPSPEGKPQADALSLDREHLKADDENSSANQKATIDSNKNAVEAETHDEILNKDTISEKDYEVVPNSPENVEKMGKAAKNRQEKTSNEVETDVIRVDSKPLKNVSSANTKQNELPLDDNNKDIESNDEKNGTNDELDRTSWEEATDKIAEKVTERDAHMRKVSVSSLIGDKDKVNDEETSQPKPESSEHNAKDNNSMDKDEQSSDNLASTEQSAVDIEQKSINGDQDEIAIKPETPAESEADKQLTEDTKSLASLGSAETKSIDQNFLNNISDESKKEGFQSVEGTENDKSTSAKASENDLHGIDSISNENDSKVITESDQTENHMENDTKSIEQNDAGNISSETKPNEAQSNESAENDNKKPTSPDTNNNDSKILASVQSELENRIDIEQSETKLDLNIPDEASDEVYSTPPESGNERSANTNGKNDEVDSKSATGDKSKEKNPSQSADLPENSTDTSNTLQDDSREGVENAKHDGNNESKPDSPKPEQSNLVDEVKENQTVLPTENTASHSEGVNESMEKSTMPTEEPSVDEPDGEKGENQSVQNVNTSAIDRMEDTMANEKAPSAHSKSIDRKVSIGIEPSNEYDAKSTNDDVASESSVSLKDEYEQAETEVVGDESVKDLDLSSNHDLEPNQANESAESEQQITALEIPPENDDSIDSPKQMQMQPDSLDILVDSLDASLEPSVDADSLNIDSLEDKPRSAKSTDTGKLKDSAESIIEEVSRPIDAKDEMNNKANQDNDDTAQPSVQNEPEQTTKSDTNHVTLLAVPKVKRSTENESIDPSSPEETVMGDLVDYKISPDIMHDQMRNELEVLRLAEYSVPIQLLGITEVNSPLTPKQDQTTIFVSTPDDTKKTANDLEPSKDDENQKLRLDELKTAGNEIKIEDKKEKADHEQEETDASIDAKKADEQSEESFEAKHEDRLDEKSKSAAEFTEQSASFSESVSDSNTTAATEDQTEQSSEFYSTTIETSETQTSEDVIELVEVVEIVEKIKCVEYLKPISHDTPSSDLSDTDTTDKAEKVYTESGVDETSRDERDEASEIENFDLSSCGEDSLEAMYYMIRKNEIIMDRHKQTSAKNCEDEKIIFPEKATDDLEHAVREVSGGKKVKLCSISMNSSVDDVILKKMSSDSDEIQIHVIPNSEIDSSSSGGSGGGGGGGGSKSCPLKEQCTANESTDDEYINPIVDSMRKNEAAVNEMQAKALSVQPNQSETQSDEQLETDTFNEMDDMMPGNIERKILASSVSEADSDYFELPPTASRLTKDDFNVSTAFEHMIRADNSTTDESDSTIESAATKIQATARGFLTRRRIRKSSAGTSASNEKRSSIGNAAIDKSLDNLIEQQELMEENAYDESFEKSSPHSRDMVDSQTIDSVDSEKMLGITEVKVEQRKNEVTNLIENAANENSDEKVPEINFQGISEESATAQRRLMLQRGDAMQRNSTPESSEQQQQQQQQQQVDKDKSNKEPNNEENNQDAKNMHDDDDPKIDTPLANVSKSISKPLRGLGPRQRSMPVQIDAQVIRVLPKQVTKRVKSASSSSSKNHRPYFF